MAGTSLIVHVTDHVYCAHLQKLAGRPDAPVVCVSQYEVYNEQIFDLLDEEGAGARQKLQLKEDPHGRVFVGGLSEVCPRHLLWQGLKVHVQIPSIRDSLFCRELQLASHIPSARRMPADVCRRWR